jgi:hypothetical protein
MDCVTSALLLDTYFVSNFQTCLKQQGFSSFTVSSCGNVSAPSAFQANRTFIYLLLGSVYHCKELPFQLSVLLGEVWSLISNINVLRFITLSNFFVTVPFFILLVFKILHLCTLPIQFCVQHHVAAWNCQSQPLEALKSSLPSLYLLHCYTADIENVIVNVSLLLLRVILNI